MSTDNTPEGLRALVWRQVETGPETKCWPWLGPVGEDGYGRVYVGGGRSRGVHRVAYELKIGPIPEGLVIDHLCRNRACCNPAHLEPVTNRENILRGIGVSAINARRIVCVNGHPFDEENTYNPPRGGRDCKTCKSEAAIDRLRGKATCQECGAKVSRRHLARHRAEVHQGATPATRPQVACPECGVETHSSNLARHTRRAHPEVQS